MSDNKPKYILCPRCELNWIPESEGYCVVCKAEMGLIDKSILIPDEDEMAEKVCPICKINHITEDEDMCPDCKREKEAKEIREEDDESWREYVEEEVMEDGEEMSPLSLEEMAEDEAENDEEEGYDDPSGDDFDYGSVNPDDFLGDDEDDEEDEEDEEGEDEE